METKTMNVTVVSGSFSAKGNFTARTAFGKRFFINGTLMEAQGWKKIEDVKFPFHAIVGEELITPWDENGNPKTDENGNPVKELRTQAFSIFTDVDAIAEAYANESSLNIKIAKAVKQRQTAEGITDEDLAKLANVPF